MTITVTDTNTGQALTVTAVAAELARLDPPTSYARLYTNDLAAINERAAEDVAHALLSGANELRAIGNGVWDEHELLQAGGGAEAGDVRDDHAPSPELPPDPALALAPDVLDAEQAARDERAEVLRRQKVLKGAVDRTPVPPSKPFVPRVPWRIRLKRAVVAVLQRDAEERAL